MPLSLTIANNAEAASIHRASVTTVAVGRPESDGDKRVLKPGESVTVEVPQGCFLILDEETKEP